uniref:Reverse transcriptase zinc-binding domain-containing protein n=1 Tax=Cannabis sativa TaxID=3483 RepID=A0A803NZ03_CANSA
MQISKAELEKSHYSIGGVYHDISFAEGNKFCFAELWNKNCVPKHRFFCLADRLLQHLKTKGRLIHFGITMEDSRCFLCGQDDEDHTHLLFACSYNRLCLDFITNWLNIHTRQLSIEGLLLWVKRSRLSKLKKGAYMAVIYTI